MILFVYDDLFRSLTILAYSAAFKTDEMTPQECTLAHSSNKGF